MVTAFVIDAYKTLQPVIPQLTAQELVAALRKDTSITLTESLPIPATAYWINGFYFVSLFMSLCVAFLCILVKQWLAFCSNADVGDSLLDWVRVRQLRFDRVAALAYGRVHRLSSSCLTSLAVSVFLGSNRLRLYALLDSDGSFVPLHRRFAFVLLLQHVCASLLT